MLLTLGLAASGCVIRIPGDGTVLHLAGHAPIEVRDDGYYVDGVALRHQRWVMVEGRLEDAAELVLQAAAGDIDVTAGAGRDYALEVRLNSEIEGDGDVFFDGGRLTARSQAAGKVLIDAIRGTAPGDIAVSCSSGMGDVSLRAFSGGHAMRLDVGMGDGAVEDCELGGLEIESGMGTVAVLGVVALDVVIDSGMGPGVVRDCRLASLDLDFGMGSVEVADSTVGEVRADLGMGSLDLQRCRLEALQADLGMGDVVLRGTERPARFAVDTGMGRVRDA